ncbi:NADH dehydrogenase [ubiquinone] 1 beta subcomplex subunit 3 [Nomia melanderi]|uniref:NADH dehydrogenase [ubiquinone] 1 beta subcomplex subunit 3 n=1 Tax=Nomia melanderi TaxID=2448451 RepID=UPI00130425CA|nr:NADH dehydrogenase [ubiquinone] 1 beta subcomplex subunit 3 [Nomia melanderi]
MGHGHGPLPEIPSPDIYKVENCPKLKAVQDELAKQGLKDPWLRNEVWRYQNSRIPRKKQLLIANTRGMALGFAAFLITIGIEKYFGIDYNSHHGDGHHGGGDHEGGHH